VNPPRSYALAVLAGAIAALGHAPFGLWPAGLFGFFGLLWLGTRPAARAGLIAWLGGLGYFGVSMHWIVEPFLVDIATHGWMAPFALIFLAAGLSLFWAMAGVAGRRLATGAGSGAFAFVVTLSLAELLRGHVFTGFPWALPAYIWADTPLIGATAFTGSYGLSFLTLLGAALPLIMSRVYLGLLAAGALFLGLMLPAWFHTTKFEATLAEIGTVRLIQPNVPQSEKWDAAKVPDHIRRLVGLTRSSPNADVDMVVWPEVAVVYPLDAAGDVLLAAQQATSQGASEKARLITGINRRDDQGNWFNSLVVLGPDGAREDIYDKVHLVPFGEYIPLKIDFIRALAASSGFGFTAGEKLRLVDTPLGRALPLICYEGIFPGHLLAVKERPDYLLQITNDAWFGTFSGPYQHLDQARFRAAEQGLSMVRVANTGVSTVIDPLGRVQDTLSLGTNGMIDQTVYRGFSATFYARTGDLPIVFVTVFCLAVLIFLKRRNIIAKRPTTF